MEDDFFDDYNFTPSYSDITQNLEFTRKEVDNLDQDSLIDEISGIQHNLVGESSTKVQHLIFKSHADQDLDEEELSFLRNVYVLYYCQFIVVIDEPEDDDEEQV